MSLVFGCASRNPRSRRPRPLREGFTRPADRLPVSTTPVAGKIFVYDDAAMTGPPVASAQTDAQGHFTVTVAPGTYYLAGTTPSVSGARCVGPGAITAAPSIATTADVTCQLK